jgi:hypothetical protein
VFGLNTVSERVDFSGNAKVYDRRHGAVLAKDVVQRLAAAAAIRSGTSVQGCCLTRLAADGGRCDHEPPWLNLAVDMATEISADA